MLPKHFFSNPDPPSVPMLPKHDQLFLSWSSLCTHAPETWSIVFILILPMYSYSRNMINVFIPTLSMYLCSQNTIIFLDPDPPYAPMLFLTSHTQSQKLEPTPREDQRQAFWNHPMRWIPTNRSWLHPTHLRSRCPRHRPTPWPHTCGSGSGTARAHKAAGRTAPRPSCPRSRRAGHRRWRGRCSCHSCTETGLAGTSSPLQLTHKPNEN